MEIKRFDEFEDDGSNSKEMNEKARTELFGTSRRPSYVISRQNQDFYDFYTRRKFRGLSKYKLNSEIFKMAQKKDEIGILAQFCLQIERESIAADDYIVKLLEEITELELKDGDVSTIRKMELPTIDNEEEEEES